jgi:hypothetical protein
LSFPYNNIFNIPEKAILNRKLTKSFFLKNFSLSASEKKVLNNTILSMQWLASLKATNVNIPSIKTEEYVYEEIQVFVCTLPIGMLDAYSTKCIELFQKFIPYQMLVINEDENEFVVNVCDKRINQNDKSKRTVEKYITSQKISKLYKNEVTDQFFKSLDFSILDKTNLETTYKSYIKALIQLQTANITGNFVSRPQKRTEEDMNNLMAIGKLETEIISLANQIKKESQLNNKVALNIKIQGKRKEIEQLKNKLNTL